MNFSCKISKILSERFNSGKEFIFFIDFDCSEFYVFSPQEAAANAVYFNFNGKTNFTENIVLATKRKFNFKAPLFDEYLKGFEICCQALQRGDTYLINYTYQTQLETDYNLKEIFALSMAPFKLLFKDKFVIFSPERFVKVSGSSIETCPMKGTIDANIPNAEKLILENQKELFEHNTIVDLLRNDLNIVATNVSVERFRYIDKINTIFGDILQVSSLIKGTIKPEFRNKIGELLIKILPAGSVTGAPKKRTVELIKMAENYNRGFYTGIFGYFDGKTLDTAVSIRFIESENGQLYFKSGGGITALSNPKDEYNEMIKKIYVPIV